MNSLFLFTLSEIKEGTERSVMETTKEELFFRQNDRQGPHNIDSGIVVTATYR